MPHGQRPLLKQQTEILRLWVKQGAKKLIHLVRASLTLSLSLTREGASECERVRVKADASVHVRPDLALQRGRQPGQDD